MLIERAELGAGSTTVGATRTSVSSFVDEQGVTVTVEVQSDDAGQRMGVVKGPISGKSFDVGSMGEVLEPVDPAAEAATPAKATRTFHVEFAGVETDGVTTLVVTQPDYLGPGSDASAGFRVFLGPTTALGEQAGPVTVELTSDTQVFFAINGAQAELDYGVYGSEGDGTLTVGTDTEQLSGVVRPVVPVGTMFICR